MRVLFVEDDATLGRVLTQELTRSGFEVVHRTTGEAALAEAPRFQPEVALVDLKLPGLGGLDLLRELRQLDGHLQVVVLSGHGSIPEAVEAMRRGAYDFLTKPTHLDVLEQTLRRAGEKADLLLENERLRRAASARDDPYEMLGESPAVEGLRRLVGRIAPTTAAVLIQGENGTGKELIARNLHRLSPRSDQPFVVVNCGAMPSELVESELFGHEKGAFTGAERRRVGLFEAAHRGTLFLDEVGELPLAAQPALLRVLQFGEIRPVGSDRTRIVDVRGIAATNRDLLREVREGRFREDLYYRLATFQIEVPPLRERDGDIPILARHFLKRAAARAGRRLRFDEAALRHLSTQPWPGNIRELDNAVIRLSVLAEGETITARDVDTLALGAPGRGAGGVPPGAPGGALPTLRVEELERLAIRAALEKHGGNKTAAAEELGISLRTLYNKLEGLARQS
jgi:DNA-binding NtrC family response regulator